MVCPGSSGSSHDRDLAGHRLRGGMALDPHESDGCRPAHVALFGPTSVILALPYEFHRPGQFLSMNPTYGVYFQREDYAGFWLRLLVDLMDALVIGTVCLGPTIAF